MKRLLFMRPGPLPLKWALVFQETAFALVIVVIVTGAMILRAQASHITRLTSAGQQAHGALCVFKADLQARHAEGVAYLAAIRAGKLPPIVGISTDQIQMTLRNQQATIDSLALLVCPRKGQP